MGHPNTRVHYSVLCCQQNWNTKNEYMHLNLFTFKKSTPFIYWTMCYYSTYIHKSKITVTLKTATIKKLFNVTLQTP